ncbi:hypothetical protein OIU77_003191, partial [Salix suchowensis]
MTRTFIKQNIKLNLI